MSTLPTEVSASNPPEVTEAQAQQLMEQGTTLASKAVIVTLRRLIKDAITNAPQHKEDGEALLNVMLPECQYSGAFSLPFSLEEFKDHILNISLVSCPIDYVAVIDVPTAEYAKTVFDYYNIIKTLALAYWKTYRLKFPDRVEMAEKILGYNLDLKVDQAQPTTLYFAPTAAHRVGIYAYYSDRKGQVYIKRDAKSDSAAGK